MRSSNHSPLTYCQSNCIINKKDRTVKPDTIGWPLIYSASQRKKTYLACYKRIKRLCEVKKMLTIVNSLISVVFLLLCVAPIHHLIGESKRELPFLPLTPVAGIFSTLRFAAKR